MKQFFKIVFASMLAQILIAIITLFLIFSMIAGLAVRSSETVTVAPNSILEITMSYGMPDRAMASMPNPFDVGMSTVGLNSALDAIKKAQDDENIRGIYLNLTMGNSVGLATFQELRNAINEFKSSGKFVWAYSDAYSQSLYYLASVADKVYMHNEGLLDFRGLANQMFFLKGTLEKIGVEMQIIRHGKFKSAIEPFVNEQMSLENRIQTQRYLNSLWYSMVSEISKSRGISVSELNRIADDMLAFESEDAKDLNLLDGVISHNEMLQMLADEVQAEKIDQLQFIDLKKYVKTPAKYVKSKNRIAVIYAQGEIGMGNGDVYAIGSENLSQSIRRAAEDDKVKAIVLRVNSPGGSALASDIILQEVLVAKAKKPVVASFGQYAASGGYYISCGANVIFAQPTTITGSIGVFGTIPNAKKLLNEKMGVTFDGVTTNANSDFMSINRPMTSFEQAKFQTMIERTYSTFISHVANGRNLTTVHVDSIGQGRVWSGVDAKRIGLVDEIGGLKDALVKAAELANISDYKIVDFPKEKDQFTQLMEMLGETKTKMVKSEIGEWYPMFEFCKSISLEPAVMARIPYIEDIK